MGSVGVLDTVAGIAPGAELAAALGGLDLATVPNGQIIDVLQAHYRQLAHAQAGVFAALHQLARCRPGADELARRARMPYDWASSEIAAALSWTPRTADRELDLAEHLIEALPAVFTALLTGSIDRAKAWIFAEHLNPTNLTDEQIKHLCTRYLPLAPDWTTRQLTARLQRAILAIDPDHARRRYQHALRERAVHHWLDPTGTVTLCASGLNPAEAEAACARLDRLAATAQRAGHPGTRPQINADLYIGMLDGRFAGLTETQILTELLTQPRPEDHPQPGTDPEQAHRSHLDAEPQPGPESEPERAHRGEPDPESEPEQAHRGEPDTDPEPDLGSDSGSEPDPDTDAPRTPTHHQPAPTPRPRTAPTGLREGIEIRVGLATLLGRDQRPADIAGLGPVLPDLAAALLTAQHHGAQWRFAILDHHGHLILGGGTRRRPHLPATTPPGRCRGGIVELHITADLLTHLAANPTQSGAWAQVIADLAEQYRRRRHLLTTLNARPHHRFAHSALTRHIHIRDRTCTHPGCTRPAHTCDLDHTHDYAHGGHTIHDDLGPCCRRHHLLKHQGDWHLHQPTPGHFHWTSPLGRTYRTHGEPIMPPLPQPQPRPPEPNVPQPNLPPDVPIHRHQPPPPETKPQPPPDHDPPPF